MYVVSNGELLLKSAFNISADCRTFKFGTGFFETLRWENNQVALWKWHLNRINSTLQFLGAQLHTSSASEHLYKQIELLAEAYSKASTLRMRICFYEKSSAGIFHVLIEATEWSGLLHLPNFEHAITLYPQPLKLNSPSAFIKSNSYQHYLNAFEKATGEGATETLILNNLNRIIEASRNNIFILTQKNTILTPPIGEGCIAGVARAFLLSQASASSVDIMEAPLSVNEVSDALEIVLTNALSGVQAVQSFAGKSYSSRVLYNRLVKTWGNHP